MGRTDSVETLAALVREKLEHCTLQLWMPDADSEPTLYVGDGEAGRALCDLPVADGGVTLLRTIGAACKDDNGLTALSAIRTAFWPVVLVACRHHRLPVPPGFWTDALTPSSSDAEEDFKLERQGREHGERTS